MPQKSYPRRFELHRVETSVPVAEGFIRDLLSAKTEGLTVEVMRSSVGAGYLFSIEKKGTAYLLRSYTDDVLTEFADTGALVRFINHVSGLAFDVDSWRLSEEMNRRIEVDIHEGEASDA